MQLELAALEAFYGSPMGISARRLLASRIRARWGPVRGETVIGLGYALPYLAAFREEARVLGALIPDEFPATLAAEPSAGAHGIHHLVRTDVAALPLPDDCVDRLLGVHFLEFAGNRRQTLREVWRVLKPEGRLLFVLPNRRGLWAYREGTPFAQGEPYSRGQIERLLDASMFDVKDCAFALAMPPAAPALLWRPGTSLERLGCALWPSFAGVVIVEATKRVAAILPRGRPQPIVARLRSAAPRRLPLPAHAPGSAWPQSLPNPWPAAA